MTRGWVGVDIGKEFHWATVVDDKGAVLLSRRVDNDEAALVALLEAVSEVVRRPTWAVDQPGGGAALLLAVLWARRQRVVYLPGIAVDRARDAHRGEDKTDARDALVIAQQARMRTDLRELTASDELIAELGLLVAHRRDLVADRTRSITRLRDALMGVFPGLERALELTTKGALILVARYQTPESLRRAGRKRIETYLRSRGVRNAASLAERALAAAHAQHTPVVGQDVAAGIVARLAGATLDLQDRIAAVDEELKSRFFCHPQAAILTSLPGMGPRLGAEFLVAVGDINAFQTADQLAAYAGLVPAARDSGKRTGNHRRMHGGNKSLKRVLYQSAFASLRSPDSRAFYDRKRREGKRHHQAVLALARRRSNVIWAMLRDNTTFKPAEAA